MQTPPPVPHARLFLQPPVIPNKVNTIPAKLLIIERLNGVPDLVVV